MSGARTRQQYVPTFLGASASIVFVVLLSGCTFGERYAIFDGEAEQSDAPPPELASQELQGIDIESLRFAIEYEGDRLYLAKGADGMGIVSA